MAAPNVEALLFTLADDSVARPNVEAGITHQMLMRRMPLGIRNPGGAVTLKIYAVDSDGFAAVVRTEFVKLPELSAIVPVGSIDNNILALVRQYGKSAETSIPTLARCKLHRNVKVRKSRLIEKIEMKELPRNFNLAEI